MPPRRARFRVAAGPILTPLPRGSTTVSGLDLSLARPTQADRERDLINMEEWAEIRRLHRAEGMGVKVIARRLGVARNTVRSALRSGVAPRYQREGPGSAVDAFEPAIRRPLAVTPGMPATVIAERIGWTQGITVLRDRVGELRPAYQVREASGRTDYKPGELCQWDLWFPDYDIPVGHGQTAVLPVLVGVACYSRHTLARMIASKECADVWGGHLGLLFELGKVPRVGCMTASRRSRCAAASG